MAAGVEFVRKSAENVKFAAFSPTVFDFAARKKPFLHAGAGKQKELSVFYDVSTKTNVGVIFAPVQLPL